MDGWMDGRMEGWMPHSSQTRIVGKIDVNSCTPYGGCRGRFLMPSPYCTLNRRRFGVRMVWMLLALSASCVFTLRLHASLPRIQLSFLTDERQLSRSEASCCHD